MTVTMVRAVCCVLFVCTFCAVIAAGAQKTDLQTAAEKAAEALAASKRAVANLTKAQTYEADLEQLKDVPDDSFFIYSVERAKKLAAAVKNATEEAQTAGDAVKGVQTAAGSLNDAELTAALKTAEEKTDSLSKELNDLKAKSDKILTTAEAQDKSQIAGIKQKVVEIKVPLGTAKKLADDAVNAHEKVVDEVKRLKDTTKPGGGVTNGDKGQQGTEPPPKGQDTNTPNPPGQKGNESSASAPTKTSREEGSTPTATQDNNDSDGAHAGAITAWAQVPLLLLLTAVAYAAVC